MMAHGDADTIVPLEFGRRLFAAANEPKQLSSLAGHDHNDGMTGDYYDDVGEFIERLGDR